MPEVDIILFVDGCLESIEAIENFTQGIDFDFFCSDRKTY